jgi:hypothetical protein
MPDWVVESRPRTAPRLGAKDIILLDLHVPYIGRFMRLLDKVAQRVVRRKNYVPPSTPVPRRLRYRQRINYCSSPQTSFPDLIHIKSHCRAVRKHLHGSDGFHQKPDPQPVF